MLATLKTGSAEAFPVMEAVSLPPAGGSASRSRVNKSKGLPVRLSGAGMEKSEYPALSAGDELVAGQRGGPDGAVDESRDQAGELEAAFEAPGEAGELAIGVFRANAAVGAGDRRLDVAQRGVDTFKWRPLGCPPAATGNDRGVLLRWRSCMHHYLGHHGGGTQYTVPLVRTVRARLTALLSPCFTASLWRLCRMLRPHCYGCT